MTVYSACVHEVPGKNYEIRSAMTDAKAVKICNESVNDDSLLAPQPLAKMEVA
jgi:hypothetical protein